MVRQMLLAPGIGAVHRRDSGSVAAHPHFRIGHPRIRTEEEMVRPMLRLVASALLVTTLGAAAPALAQTAGGLAAAAQAPKVNGAWVRLPAASGRPAGGYLVVASAGPADALVGASSPMAERVELHSMAHENGVMRMRQESALAVPAGGTLALAPGGNHLMLFGLSPGLKPGAKVAVTLSFRSGAKVNVEAEARAPGAPAAAPKAAEPAHQH
jgi:copper(I)-binding protein